MCVCTCINVCIVLIQRDSEKSFTKQCRLYSGYSALFFHFKMLKMVWESCKKEEFDLQHPCTKLDVECVLMVSAQGKQRQSDPGACW